MNITREQIKKAFVSDPKDIGDVYNNQDWYQQDAQRMRYILATQNYHQVTITQKSLDSMNQGKRTIDTIIAQNSQTDISTRV